MRGVLLLLALSGCLAETLPASVDPDHDGFSDAAADNCPGVANPDQLDSNDDGVGDACSTFCTRRCTNPETCACIDFDESTEIPPDWEVRPESQSTIALTTGDVRSAPRALSIQMPSVTYVDGHRNYATFGRGLLASNYHMVWEFDWKLSYFDTSATKGHSVELFRARLANFAGTGFGHVHNGTEGWFQVAGLDLDPARYQKTVPAPPTDAATWTRIRVDVKFSSSGQGHYYLFYDGTEILHEENLTNMAETSGPQTLGGYPVVWCHQGTNPSVDTLIDNLWFEVD